MGIKIIEPADIVGPNDEEYILTVTLILGKLPVTWWNSWGRGENFYEAGTLETHGELIAKPGKISNDTPLGPGPKSIREKITSSCYSYKWNGGYQKNQGVSEVEASLLADLVGRLLRYVQEERLPAQEAAEHDWFKMMG